MRVVIQRVLRARVTVQNEETGRIGPGILAYVGIERGDGEGEVDFMADKVVHLRIFPDRAGRMDRSVLDTGGAVLSVSQFTLASRIRKGRRPDFGAAAEPLVAERLYNRFNDRLLAEGLAVATGRFGALMQVESVNDGPVTFVIERRHPGEGREPGG